jgi:Flp pilus assembly protein CpaB
MRNAPARSSVFTSVLLAAAVLVVGVVGTVGALWYMGVPIPFLSRARAAYVPAEGTEAVYLSTKEIPAYTKITREHILDGTGSPSVSYLSLEDIQKRKLLTDPNAIVGRVVARDFKAGYAFKDEDFLAKGTQPGVVGGTPPGKRAFVLDASKVQGIYALKLGDHFDLLASELVDHAKGPGTLPPQGPEPKKHAVVKALVQNGVVVLPVANRPTPPGNPAKKAQDKPVQEIIIAVAPEEIAPLQAALTVGADIFAAYRSGHPDDAKAAKQMTPGTPPPTKTTTIEVIQDGKRETLSFPHSPTANPPPAAAASTTDKSANSR